MKKLLSLFLGLTILCQPVEARRWIPKIVASGYDPDAAAFFTAAGITDTTQKSAVNQLVLDLKAASVWTKLTALYPFVGGSSSSHSYNLINTATYQITWGGTVTHNANGVTGNGSTGYGDTGLNLNTTTANSLSFGVYVRTTESGGGCDIAAWSDGSGDGVELLPSFFGTTTYYDNLFNGSSGRCSFSDSVGTRLLISDRTASNRADGYSDGTSQCNTTGAQGTLVSATFNFFRRSSVAGLYAANNIALGLIGIGLTSTEITAITNAVTTYETTLGRNV